MTRLRSLVVAACLVLVAGCSNYDVPDPDDAMIGPSANPVPRCVQSAKGKATVLLGSFTVNRAIELSSVELDGASGVEVIKAFVMPYAGAASETYFDADYPPAAIQLGDRLDRWYLRKELEGATVQPGDGRQALVLGLRLTGDDDASLTGAQVDYWSEGLGAERDFPMGLEIAPPSRACAQAGGTS